MNPAFSQTRISRVEAARLSAAPPIALSNVPLTQNQPVIQTETASHEADQTVRRQIPGYRWTHRNYRGCSSGHNRIPTNTSHFAPLSSLLRSFASSTCSRDQEATRMKENGEQDEEQTARLPGVTTVSSDARKRIETSRRRTKLVGLPFFPFSIRLRHRKRPKTDMFSIATLYRRGWTFEQSTTSVCLHSPNEDYFHDETAPNVERWRTFQNLEKQRQNKDQREETSSE